MCGFKFERESGRDFSLELRELVLAFEDMITTFTTLLYFNLWWYYCVSPLSVVNVSTTFWRHHGISFQLFSFLS